MGGGQRRRASTDVVRSGVAVADARPRPRRARRRRRARPGDRLLLPVHRRRAHQPGRRGRGRCPTGSPDALRPRRRQLPVVRDRRVRRLPAPARRGRSTSSCTSATTSTSTRAPDGRAHDAARPRRSRRSTDYRLRYASYRLDEDLRNAHHRFPFVLTWDDHEVSNNYSGDGLAEQPGDARRGAGAQDRRLPGVVGAPAGAGRPARRRRARGAPARRRR